MAKSVTLALTPDELEIIADALEADMEGYVESAKEARESGSRDDVTTFAEAAQRVQKLLLRVQELIEDED
jgi:predicted outer membrane protein